MKRLRRLRRQHVHVLPALVVGPGLEEGHVERAETLADLLEAIEVTAVTAEEEIGSLPANDPGGPQGLVAIAKATAGEVLGRGGDKLNAADPGLLPPIQLPDLVPGDTPGNQARPHAERRDEVADLLLQRQDGVMVEVVVVIMGEDHRLYGGQRIQGDGRCVPALGAKPLHRRGALAEHGIRQPELALQFEQQTGVAEAPHAVVRGGYQPFTAHGLHRDGAIRHSAIRLGEQKIPPEPYPFPGAALRQCHDIAELTRLILGRVRVRGQARFQYIGKDACHHGSC
ncbi:hypothetical protein D3C85_666710 [compost metagenome]